MATAASLHHRVTRLLGGTEWDNPVAPLGLSSLYPVATSTTFILSEPPASSEGQATVA
ncbi:hypothetical protein FB107DRAFT_280825 [Schizophyllum commune]